MIPFGLTMVMFSWGASIFFKESRPPDERACRSTWSASSGCGSCSTWKGGARSTSCTSRWAAPVKLTMTSEDVIHSFFVPAFRIKQDVVPGRYGDHLVRADQARQVSPVLRRVLRHQALRHDRLDLCDGAAGLSDLAERRRGAGFAGADRRRSCSRTWPAPTATSRTASGRCPTLVGLFGKKVQLAGGGTVTADEAYIRESILQPTRESGGRLPADHADVPGTGDRRRSFAVGGIHQVARAEAGDRRRVRRSTRQCRRLDAEGSLDIMITAAAQEREHYLNASYGIKSWLLTKDHKRIGLLYLATITLFFFLGGAFATLIRIELLTPAGRPGLVRDLQQAVHACTAWRWCSSS